GRHGAPLSPRTRLSLQRAKPGFDLAGRVWTVGRGLTLAVYGSALSEVPGTLSPRPHTTSAQAGGAGHSRGMRCHRVLQRRQGNRTNPSSKEGRARGHAVPVTEIKWPVFRGRDDGSPKPLVGGG